MAVIFNNNQEEKNKDQEAQGSGTTQPQVTNPGETGTVGATTSPGSSIPGKGTSSGSFTNLKNYINANQNFNAQGGGLAGKVAGNIEKQGDQVKQNVGGATNTFNNQVQQQTGQLQQNAALTQQAVQNPYAFAQNQQNVDNLAQARDAQYTGPKSLLDLQGKQNQGALQAQAQNFTDTVKQGKTETGRFNLLRNMFGQPNYSSGQQNLDNLLIQGQKDQLQKINDTSRVASDVNRNLNQNIANASQQGQQAVNLANQIKTDTRQSLNQGVTQQNAAIQQELQHAQDQQNRDLYSLVRGLQNGQVTEANADRFGLTPGQKLGNVDLGHLVQRGMDPTANTVATQDNYNQIAALNKLLGGAASEDASKILEQFADPSQAGSFKSNNYNLDTNALNIGSQASQAQFKSGADQALQQFIDQVIKNRGVTEDGVANYNNEYKKAVDTSKDNVLQQMLDWQRANNPPYKNKTDQQIISDAMNNPGNPLGEFINKTRTLEHDYNPYQKLQVLGPGTASVDDYDNFDPLTGDTKGTQLLRNLGLLK